MARISKVAPLTGPVPANVAQTVLNEATLILPLEGLIDIAVEKKRLATTLTKAEQELTKVRQKLANADFVARAPEEVLDEHREREQKFAGEAERLKAALARLA
jgi:valyl-tRNA synthetase